TIPGTIATGSQPVIVRRKTADGGMVESSSATYTVSGIEISSVTPPSGPIGIVFTINGVNFGAYNGTNTKVKFCGLVAPIVSWTDSQIKGTIPGAPAGDCELAIERVTADGGLMRGTTVFAIAGPVITSMSTSTAPIGLPITLNGANFGTYNGSYTRVKINGVVMPVTSWTDSRIQGTVPGIAQPGNYPLVVERATVDGGLSQSTGTTFGVVAPQLTTMSPTSLRVGTVAYTLNGTGFGNYNGASTVVLIGGTTTAVSVWTDTQIKGTTPGSLQTGTHQVIVRRLAQGVASDSNALTLELVLPVISGIDPATGVAGTGFTITGTGFGPYDSTVVGGYPSTRVKVGTMVASLSEWTDTQIRGIIPDTLGPGIHSVTVQRVTSAGSAVSNTVTFTIDGGSGSSGRSARGLSNFMPVRGKAAVASYPTNLVEAGLPLLKEHGGRPESWNRTSVTIAPDTLPEDMFISIALNKGEESSLEELEAALVPSKVAAAGPSTVFGPLSAKAKSPMVIELPYSASAIPDGKSELDLAIHKWNKHTSLWESIPSELDTRNKRLRATVSGFGTYQAMVQGVLYADATFKLGEIYSFPNPAKGGHKPTLHIEVGVADYVKVRIYDVAGDLRHSVQIDAAPVILDDGTGAAYAYEYAWNASGAGSGVYIYVIEAHKGDETIRATRKLTYIR
ncbi:MAG TPA: IPT/TIG domain-containing protein, partial [Elusimicrobiales bacterium]|nr:IPT/TIG domain-containing protein [Elusimicrobiales bacterium]